MQTCNGQSRGIVSRTFSAQLLPLEMWCIDIYIVKKEIKICKFPGW